MKELYENAKKWIAVILEKDYQLTSYEAMQLISKSPLKSIFEKDPQMAALKSNEDWAKYVFEYGTKLNGEQ